MFVNRDELFSTAYAKYLVGELRRAFGYEGCPIALVPKPRPRTVEPVRKLTAFPRTAPGKRARFPRREP